MKTLIIRIFAAAILIAIGYQLALQRQTIANTEYTRAQGSLQHALAEVNRLKSQLSEKDVELSILQEAQNMDDFADLISENTELKQQLSLYQQVLRVEDADSPFKIQSMVATPLADNKIHLQGLLVQGKALKSSVSGNLKVTVEGHVNGVSKRYSLKDLLTTSPLVAAENSKLAYRYQYFLALNYVIELPQDFIPEKLVINATVKRWRTTLDPVKTILLWPDILDESARVGDNT